MADSPKCWSCEKPAGTGDVCASCGKLQPPRATDYFAYLGIPRSYHVDAEKLGDLLREKSRQFHPDRFARAEPRERTNSLSHTTYLNDAVRTLRDPQRRAEYVLSLYGLKAGANDRERAKMDPSFLMEMMEVRESLADAKAAADKPALEKIGLAAKADRDALLAKADASFTAWEKDLANTKPLVDVVPLLDKIRYFEQIVAEAAGLPTH